ncbi:uncharacterized protein RJT20DRAFT_127670 [Scheffersomyces xylosifermentans]|uniref:uncharacterized protein n=1 Tax=Scheffersomyces xylosifermentans TaxID=1304137 RepID=UPI00315CA8A4
MSLGFEGSAGDLGYNGFPVHLNYFSSLPDPSIIHDPQMTIVFKSLMKKDAITKEKSLADLISASKVPQNTAAFQDDLTIITWIQLYPKLAIDNSRAIRTASHQVQAIFLELVGGKAYSKYLKSTLPIWLSGVFDNEKSVAAATFKSLLESFQDDKDKVENKIWVIFYEQIVNYINTAILIESPESLSDKRYTKESDANSKYERVLNTSLQMLIKVIGLVNNGVIPLETVNFEEMGSLLQSDKLWNYLGTSITGDTMNLPLFKTLLETLKVIFASTSDKEVSPFTKNVDDVRGLYKTIAKKFIKLVKLKNNKATSSGNIIYSSFILQFWDTLRALTLFSGLSDIKSLKIKKNFWELGGNKSYTRFVEYLKLGSCNSSPTYYVILRHFFIALSETKFKTDDEDFEFLDFDDLEDASLVLIKILGKQYKTLPNYDFKEKAVQCILSVYQQFQTKLKQQLDQVLKVLLYLILDSFAEKTIRRDVIIKKNDIMNELNSFLVEVIPIDQLKNVLEDFNDSIVKSVIENKSKLEIGGFEFQSSLIDLVRSYFEFINQNGLKDTAKSVTTKILLLLEEDSTIEKPSQAFKVASIFLDIYKDDDLHDLNSFLEVLPSFIESDFIDEPIALLQAFTKLSIPKDSIVEAINGSYLKILMEAPSLIPIFLNSLEGQVDFEKEKESYPEIYQYLSNLSSKENLSIEESNLLYSQISVPGIFDNLVQSSATSKARSIEFVKVVANHGSISSLSDHFNSVHLRTITRFAWEDIKDKDVSKFFEWLKSDETYFKSSLYDYIKSATDGTKFDDIASFLKGKAIPIETIKSSISDALRGIPVNLVSLSNPLEHNVYLSSTSLELRLDSTIISIGRFFDAVLKSGEIEDENVYVTAAFVSEYINDFLILQNFTKLSNSDEYLTIREDVMKSFLGLFKSENFEVVISTVNNEQLDGSSLTSRILSTLNSSMLESDEIRALYASRIFKRVLDLYFENMSLKSFEDSQWDHKNLLNFPIKLSAFQLSTSRFFTSPKFDRIRNYVAAEILGVRKESDILTEGLRWLSLSINFFNVDEKVEVIPSHRLAMICNQLSNWLESGIAYDESFISMRVLLAKFLNGLILKQTSLPDKVWELASQVITDNLSTCQGESSRLDLKFFTLKLLQTYWNLSKKSEVVEWSEISESVYEELLDLFTNQAIKKFEEELNNHVVIQSNDLLVRVLLSVDLPIEALREKEGSFYSVVSHCSFSSLKRVAVFFLSQVIVPTQQELVVEYQLSKSTLNQDGEYDGSNLNIEIPPTLLEVVEKPLNHDVEDNDADSSNSIASFVWSWYLIFSHFEDITYSLRAEYIKHLKEKDSIDYLLNYIFEQVDVADNKFLKKLSLEEQVKPSASVESIIQNYDISEGFPAEEFTFELKFVLVHLYYLSLRYIGSYVQNWFKEIRDRQLKQKIEKFTVKYVSPILVTKILQEVTTSKEKLEKNDDNLTIKVNNITNEIRSVYVIDEQTMEMVVKIPHNYPLESVTVEGPLRLGVKDNQWKAWLLASQRVISLTNGSIVDAIELFNKNVNLHFSGFEDCAICYSILHQDLSLPSKTCTTCNNKFHAACLYKWFKSSGSSTCPLCRSTFNFRATR